MRLETPLDQGSATGIVADLAARLGAKLPSERRIAMVMADEPLTDAGGDGVGRDAPQSVAIILRALREAGYRTGDMPEDGAELMTRLRAGPTTTRPHAPAEEMLSFAEYSAFFAGLPPATQQRISQRWDAAERDPFFRPGRLDCGHFAIPGCRAGNIAALFRPAPGCDFDPETAWHDPERAPPHSHLAAYAWLIDGFRADAIIDLGKPDAMIWVPRLVDWK